MKLPSYNSVYQHELHGKTIYVVENDKDRNRDDNGLKGSQVIIDGHEFTVVGVESFAVPVIRKGAHIGLMVEPLPQHKSKPNSDSADNLS